MSIVEVFDLKPYLIGAGNATCSCGYNSGISSRPMLIGLIWLAMSGRGKEVRDEGVRDDGVIDDEEDELIGVRVNGTCKLSLDS